LCLPDSTAGQHDLIIMDHSDSAHPVLLLLVKSDLAQNLLSHEILPIDSRPPPPGRGLVLTRTGHLLLLLKRSSIPLSVLAGRRFGLVRRSFAVLLLNLGTPLGTLLRALACPLAKLGLISPFSQAGISPATRYLGSGRDCDAKYQTC